METSKDKCEQGVLCGCCLQCEEMSEKADKAIQAYKEAHHKRNDARALALQMRQPNNGDFV